MLPNAVGKSKIDEQDQQASVACDGGDWPEAFGDGGDQQQACGDNEDPQRSSGDDEDEQQTCNDGQDQQQALVSPAASIDVQDPVALHGHGSSVQIRHVSGQGSFLSRGSSLRSGDFAALLLPGHLPSTTSIGGAISCYKPYSLPVCVRPMQTCVARCLAFCASETAYRSIHGRVA